MKADLVEEIIQRKRNGLYRTRQTIESAQGPLININNEEYLSFSSNDYLGFANNEELKQCMINAIKKYGIGAGSSQLLIGRSLPHKNLEQKLSDFLKRDDSLVFPTGYQANLAIASALIDKNTVVIQDKLNHASLIDASMLSRGKLVRYRHKDIKQLESLLEKYKQQDLIVITDGVFSMDGDFAPLMDISELCNRYNALLIVDDAHGLGVLGRTGAGLLEQLNIDQNQAPLITGTFGKAFGACGAFVSGNKEYIEAFIQKARTYMYTTALLPAVADTMVKAIDLVVKGESMRSNLNDLIRYYKNGSKAAGLNIKTSDTHIQPLLIGNAEKTTSVSNALFEKKIIAPAIRPPTVPAETSRLRISITTQHTKSQIDKLISCVREALYG
jgi:8-amino-7-oxononanoate synthase